MSIDSIDFPSQQCQWYINKGIGKVKGGPFESESFNMHILCPSGLILPILDSFLSLSH